MKKVRTRIAPSPTGSPHIGTAYAALFNYVFARQNKGDFVLRIEDTDRSRYVEGSEDEIFQALAWLGLAPDESPAKGGQFGPYRQSERLEIYKEYLQKLIASKKAYYCDCTSERLEKLREEQQARGEMPHYDRKCRTNPPKDTSQAVVRLAIPEDGETKVQDKIRGEVVFQNKILDDQVLLKSDGFPTYHLANVVDDHLMEISHVIRAEEWLSSAPKHILLYEAFGWEVPEFAHLPLLRNSDRSKISKRKNPVAITFYKEQGYLPEALINFLGLLGWSNPTGEEIFDLNAMVKNFSFDRISPAGPIFDLQKLEWLNGEYIRKMPDSDLVEALKDFTKVGENEIKRVLPLVKERLKKLSDFDLLTSYFFTDIAFDTKLATMKTLGPEGTKKAYEELIKELSALPSFDKEALEETLHEKPEQYKVSRTEFFQSLRAAVTGTLASPPLFDTMATIGKYKVLERLQKGSEQLK